MSEAQIAWALGELGPNSKRLRAYASYEQYYRGLQPLAFATDKYRTQFWTLFRGFADNMCMSVVDVQAERLEVLGFTSSTATVEEVIVGATESPDKDAAADAAEGETDVPNFPGVSISIVDDPMGDEAWDEWEDKYLPLVADQVHTDAFMYGDAFVITDDLGVWRQSPYEMAVRYSKDKPGVIDLAAKMWRELPAENGSAVTRLNIYSADVDGNVTLSRYATRAVQDDVELKAADFAAGGEGGSFTGMPVVHFANKRYGSYGISEIMPVIPLQNALNKASMDLIIAMEYQAFQQRYVTGVDVEIDPETGLPKEFVGKHGPGNYLAIADPEAKVGSFDAADLAPYVKVIGDLRAQIARVAGVPPHYFFSDGGATISGEALKTGEVRFERKGKRQQRCFGKAWEGLMSLVISHETDDEAAPAGYDPADEDLNVIWDDLSPRSPSEEMDVLLKKQAIGVPNSQLQKEAGYDPDQVMQFCEEFAENIRLGLIAAPQPPVNPTIGSGAKIAVGESPASTASGNQLGTTPGATPPSE